MIWLVIFLVLVLASSILALDGYLVMHRKLNPRRRRLSVEEELDLLFMSDEEWSEKYGDHRGAS